MKNTFILIALFFVSIQMIGQEVNARITVNADNIPNTNKQVFQTLEQELTEFVNQKKWTNRNFLPQEKIDCAFTITLTEQPSSNEFKGNIQVQSARPVYNSTYLTSIFNFRDSDVSFQYTEYENLQYNPNGFDSNIVSILAFYVYTILGVDADSFEKLGGTIYFDQAENVVNQAQQGGYAGWTSLSSGMSRYRLITDILSPALVDYREALYIYHFKGLDTMLDEPKEAKQNIYLAIQELKNLYGRRPNAALIRVFMDAKADEIVNIYSGGPRFETDDLVNDLTRISGTNVSKWNEIE